MRGMKPVLSLAVALALGVGVSTSSTAAPPPKATYEAAPGLDTSGCLTANADDGRSLRLSLTAAGKQLHARVAPAAIELEARVLAGLSASEVTALKAMLRRIETAATQLLTEE